MHANNPYINYPTRPEIGGWWSWALVTSLDGVVPIWMVDVSASVNLSLEHKVHTFSCTSSPGWSRKKDHKTVLVCGGRPEIEQLFIALFLGPPGSVGARRELLDLWCKGRLTGRHTDRHCI